MEFRILGTLEVESEGTRLDLGPPKQQAVLAVLLLHANEIVSTEQLIEQVWPQRPPALRPTRSRSTSRTCAGPSNRTPAHRSSPPGHRASGRDALRSALRMWRGPPLSDFTYEEFAQSFVHRPPDSGSMPWRSWRRYDRATSVVVGEYSRGVLTPGARVFDLASGGVDLALSGGFIDDIQPQLEQLRSQIVSGDIEVPVSLGELASS